MKAVVYSAPGGVEVLREETRPDPRPGPHEIRVRVHASALNRADIYQRQGNYPAPAGSPADIPGIEYAGEVESVGDGASLWRIGDRVMGIVGGGAHAELLVTHEREAIRVPQEMSWENAAAIPEVFLTAYDALFRQAQLGLGQHMLVHAVGSGVGTAAVQLARAAGAFTIGTSRTADKLARAKELGLDVGIDGSDAEWPARVEKEVGKNAIHVVLDLVGGNYLAGNLRVLAPRGQVIVVGTVAGSRTEINLGQLLGKRATVRGTVLRARPVEEKITLAREFSERVLPLLDTGRVWPVVERVFAFARIGEAHALMESNETFGKVVLTWS